MFPLRKMLATKIECAERTFQREEIKLITVFAVTMSTDPI